MNRTIIYVSSSKPSKIKFTKFFMVDLFDRLVPCTEQDFESVVGRFIDLYDMERDGRAQNFYLDGELRARREF